jgi:allophanate hydrolase subunit 2
VGGFEGRALCAGDRLAVGDAPPCDEPGAAVPGVPDPSAPIAVVLGPDLDRFPPRAVERLLAGPFAVDARSDRIGTRLVGPSLERLDADDGLSAPMVRGAIQVPASGQPIVLGPDHPTTGGYPVLATVVQESLGALGARPVGAPVRFVTI